MKILVTLPTDPTLAAQALAAIRAVPGVEVEEARVEVRNIGGALDEVAGVGHFHLEQMADGHWWMDLGGVHVDLTTRRAPISARSRWEPFAMPTILDRADSARVDAPVVAAPPVELQITDGDSRYSIDWSGIVPPTYTVGDEEDGE